MNNLPRDKQIEIVAALTFGWTGSRTTYYALYEQPLRSLEAHPIGAVRRWAKGMLDDMRRQIEAARNEDEEQKAHWDI